MERCKICDSELIVLVEGTDKNETAYCEHCGLSEKNIIAIDEATDKPMTIFDLDRLTREIIVTYGHDSDKTTKVVVNGKAVGSLESFLRKCRYKGGMFVLFEGVPLKRDFTISKAYFRMLKLETLNSLKEAADYVDMPCV